jgi:uncharacterized protein (TIGR02147 family)
MNTDSLFQKRIIQRPQVTRFLSITEFLKAYYEYRKSNESKFSYEAWAHELGFKSRSSVRMMTYGKKNVSEGLVFRLVESLDITKTEKQYLMLLAQIKNTQNIELKKIYLEKLFELSDTKINKTEISNALDFLSSPELYLIHMIISFEDFKSNAKNIQQVLNISLVQIEKSLLKLEGLRLIERLPSEEFQETRWKSKNKFFSITSELQNAALDIFHNQTVKELSEVVNQDLVDKKLKSLYFSLSEDDFLELIENIEQFGNRLKNRYANDYLNNKKIYKVNLQAYPVTEKCELNVEEIKK